MTDNSGVDDNPPPITAEHLIYAYCRGIFPMAEHRESDELFWVDPRHRGILPLENIHISRSLARKMRKSNYSVHINSCFMDVIDACANREDTWISAEIKSLFATLNAMGMAHSLEIKQDHLLIGGIYGLAIGGCFFGESMFSHKSDGSKLALVHLCDHLAQCGFTLFDTQFITDHLASMGAIEVTRAQFRKRLDDALQHKPRSIVTHPLAPSCDVLHRNGHKS